MTHIPSANGYTCQMAAVLGSTQNIFVIVETLASAALDNWSFQLIWVVSLSEERE